MVALLMMKRDRSKSSLMMMKRKEVMFFTSDIVEKRSMNVQFECRAFFFFATASFRLQGWKPTPLPYTFGIIMYYDHYFEVYDSLRPSVLVGGQQVIGSFLHLGILLDASLASYLIGICDKFWDVYNIFDNMFKGVAKFRNARNLHKYFVETSKTYGSIQASL
ncbi:hypothetical protein RJT34_25207 [Clitoria ternatea]|uniref:Uncharacterized protein n=1 Tax=Clitoria ternatea TaxID=43366 RepID=A0AAN9FPL9_CLITE